MGMLEEYFHGDYAAVPCATEKAYYALWHERDIDALAPADSAIAGALLADRLPWYLRPATRPP